MTSVFQVIAHEDSNDQTKLRQAMALAHQRVEDRFGAFVRQGSIDDQAARFSLVEDDLKAVVAAACEQVGFDGGEEIFKHLAKNFISSDEAEKITRTASFKIEAVRKPKMCPYHSEVTDISLAEGSPQAGFNAMAQHAWSAQHCQGSDYKGDRCKFKPEMTTQTYWDTRAEKAEQRRQERAEREEALQQEQPQLEAPVEDIPENPDVPLEAEHEEIVEHNEPSAIGEGVEEAVPMAMAASVTKVAQTGPNQFEVTLAGQGGYSVTFPVQAKDEYEARQVAIRQNVSQGGKPAWATRVADTAVPKMDKRKWTPKTVGELDVDDPDGRYPTKHEDVTKPIKSDQGDRWNPSELKDIGEKTTEHQDVTQKGGPAKTEQGGTFGGGERSAVSSLLSPDAVREALAKFRK